MKFKSKVRNRIQSQNQKKNKSQTQGWGEVTLILTVTGIVAVTSTELHIDKQGTKFFITIPFIQ